MMLSRKSQIMHETLLHIIIAILIIVLIILIVFTVFGKDSVEIYIIK